MRILKALHRTSTAVILTAGIVQSLFAQDPDCWSELYVGGDNSSGALLSSVKLIGNAKGGELVLLETMNAGVRYIRIETRPGEPAEEVIRRLGSAINEVSPFNPYRSLMRLRNGQGQMVTGDQVPLVRSEGNLLLPFGGGPGGYVFAGTEAGLGIPPPPTSLSLSYEPRSQIVSLRWENPEEPYQGTTTSFGRTKEESTSIGGKRPPPKIPHIPAKLDAPSRRRDEAGLRRFHVIGCRDGVLSNAAVMTLNYGDNSQEELDTVPFTCGVSPNWSPWLWGGDRQLLVLEQGSRSEWKRFDQRPRPALKPDDKPYYQVIKTRSPSVCGGVYRKFLGLQSGHTYRLWVRMNTMELDRAQETWSYSCHAAAHPAMFTLTAEQMAGTAPPPDEAQAAKASQIAAYTPGQTTKGKFVESSTAQLGTDSRSDIRVPVGCDVITVWFRYNGPASGGVAFDWIKLQDVTKDE